MATDEDAALIAALVVAEPGALPLLSRLPARPAWMKRAACRSWSKAIFYSERPKDVEKVKRLCAGCPVRQQCLDQAIANDEPCGVWGGLTTSERRQRFGRQRGVGSVRDAVAEVYLRGRRPKEQPDWHAAREAIVLAWEDGLRDPQKIRLATGAPTSSVYRVVKDLKARSA